MDYHEVAELRGALEEIGAALDRVEQFPENGRGEISLVSDDNVWNTMSDSRIHQWVNTGFLGTILVMVITDLPAMTEAVLVAVGLLLAVISVLKAANLFQQSEESPSEVSDDARV